VTAVAVDLFAVPATRLRESRKGRVVHMQNGEGIADASLVFEAKVHLAAITPGALTARQLGQPCLARVYTQVERIRDELAARPQKVPHASEESRQVGEASHLVEPVAQADDGVERPSLEFEQVTNHVGANATLTHDGDALRRHIERRDLDATPLQGQRMHARTGTGIQDRAPAQVQPERLEPVQGITQPEGRRHIVALAVLVTHQHRILVAAEAVEQSRTVRVVGRSHAHMLGSAGADVLQSRDSDVRQAASPSRLTSGCKTAVRAISILRAIARTSPQPMPLLRWLVTVVVLPAAVLACWSTRLQSSGESGAGLRPAPPVEPGDHCDQDAFAGFEVARQAHDLRGNRYHLDSRAQVIRRVAADGTVSILAGRPAGADQRDARATAITFNHPMSILFDGIGALYVADAGDHTIRKVDLETSSVTTVAGVPGVAGFDVGGQAGRPARLNKPGALAFHGDRLLVVDSGNHAIRWVAEPQVVLPYAGVVGLAGDPEPASRRFITHFRRPSAIKVMPVKGVALAGLQVLDEGNCAVREISDMDVVTLSRCDASCRQRAQAVLPAP
jgi:hypothetical protein